MTLSGSGNLPVDAAHGDLCFTTLVFGGYQRYVPYYVYSALRSYPSSWVRVFVEAPVDEGCLAALQAIRQQLSGRFDLVEHEPAAPPAVDVPLLRVDPRTFSRFLVPPDLLAGFRYVYAGDVDMFFLPESPSLLDFHLEHMKRTGLPISNCVRFSRDGTPTERLTGLHFFKTEEYFSALGPLIEKLGTTPSSLRDFLAGLSWDEEALYRLVGSEFDISGLVSTDCERPWHGLHLGAARKHRPTSITTERFRENSSLPQEVCASIVQEWLSDPLLDTILRLCPDRSFFNYFLFLNLRAGSMATRFAVQQHSVVGWLKEIKRRIQAVGSLA